MRNHKNAKVLNTFVPVRCKLFRRQIYCDHSIRITSTISISEEIPRIKVYKCTKASYLFYCRYNLLCRHFKYHWSLATSNKVLFYNFVNNEKLLVVL